MSENPGSDRGSRIFVIFVTSSIRQGTTPSPASIKASYSGSSPRSPFMGSTLISDMRAHREVGDAEVRLMDGVEELAPAAVLRSVLAEHPQVMYQPTTATSHSH